MATDIIGTPSLLRRLAAMFYDFWLVLACLLCVTALIIGLRVGIESDTLVKGQAAISGAWRLPTFAILVVFSASFFAYFWVKNGQTLGMQTWRVRVQNADGSNVSYKQAYIRFVAALFSLSFFGLGYLWVLIDKNHQSLHDKLSKSQLVLLAKKKKT